ncbi:hypothetical protein [Helicobacter sp. T3_23-1056]
MTTREMLRFLQNRSMKASISSLRIMTLLPSLRALQRNAWQSIRLSYDKHSVIASGFEKIRVAIYFISCVKIVFFGILYR